MTRSAVLRRIAARLFPDGTLRGRLLRRARPPSIPEPPPWPAGAPEGDGSGFEVAHVRSRADIGGLSGSGPRLLVFPDDRDLPYACRDLLVDSGAVAGSTSLATAHRLLLLSPNAVHAGDEAVLRRRAAGLLAAPPSAPLARAERGHVVLQADHFTEGGLEQVVIDLGLALRGAGFPVTILILGRAGTAADRAREKGLAIKRGAMDESSYRAFLRESDCALVNAHYSTFGAAVARDLGIPFVQTMHNTYLWFGDTEIAAYRRADRATAAYVCVSNEVARFADLRIGLPPWKMVVVPNGVDESARAADPRVRPRVREELGLSADAKLIVQVGSIQPSKAQHVSIGALAGVVKRGCEAHLLFLGDVADEGYAEKAKTDAERKGVAHLVHWLGRRSDVPRFLAAGDVFVQPSLFEGWSLAITEAVLSGIPVIATDVGGAREQLRGAIGTLLPAVIPDIARATQRDLLDALAAEHEGLQKECAAALLERLGSPGARANHRSAARFSASFAYKRCADLFSRLMAGEEPWTARWAGGSLP
ncbi:MAG: hypothetical protein Fur0037_00720 [Planctomycetota bacterium]